LKSEKVVKKIAKRCPGCQRYINKNGGCNHMSCVYYLSVVWNRQTNLLLGLCGRQFCWNCCMTIRAMAGTVPKEVIRCLVAKTWTLLKDILN
jgi:hypothetical protein